MPATVKLLTQANSLMGENPERLELLPDLAIALVETGEFAAAESLLEETMREAKRLDLAGVQAPCDAGRPAPAALDAPQEWNDRAIEEAEQAARIFEEIDDQRGLAKAWGVIGEYHWLRCTTSQTRKWPTR